MAVFLSRLVPLWSQPGSSVPAPSPTPITIGQALVHLYGPWKFQVGDSPSDASTRQPLWAEPTFDDSNWETVDLSPQPGSSDYVPGWTGRGHKGHSGFAWYRITLQLRPPFAEEVAVAGPANVDDGYQLFVNGALVGSLGDFTRTIPNTGASQPRLFKVPVHEKGVNRPINVVLSFRVWMRASSLNFDRNAGGFHSAPLIGELEALSSNYQVSWMNIIRGSVTNAIMGIALTLAALMAFSLILFDRSDTVYLWFGGVFLVGAMARIVVALWYWEDFNVFEFYTILCVLWALISALSIMQWWVWFGRRPRWMPYAALSVTTIEFVSNYLSLGFVDAKLGLALSIISPLSRMAIFLLVLGIVIQGIRRQKLEGWLVVPSVLLMGITLATAELQGLGLWPIRSIFGVTISLGDLADAISMLTVAALLLRRLMLSLRRQRIIALDVKQAQEVQQVILPEARTVVPGDSDMPGLVIESVYRPAREVGGDFFQIIPHPADGSLLIVAGDVAGKGLQAGMLVALLVGAIRTTVDWSADPVLVLRALNHRLLGRANAAATCLALSIEADGLVTLANAGHMPPYLNGQPLPMEGALPLGMFAEAECSVMRFKLEPDDRLVLMSDGIVEAMDERGQLFGFDRIQTLLNTHLLASQIADAAQDFGQEDDISVVSILRA